MSNEHEQPAKSGSLPSLISWIGVCLLSAAWGPVMPEVIRSVWAYLGLFGLAAGLGLAALERMRVFEHKRQERQEEIRYLAQEVARFERVVGR